MKTYADELKIKRESAIAEMQRIEELRKNYQPVEDDTIPQVPYRAPVQSARLTVHDVPCMCCEDETVKRGAIVCPACRDMLTKQFGRFEDMPFHQELLKTYRDVFLNGSGRSPLDKTGNTQVITLNVQEGNGESSEANKVEPKPKGFMPGDVSYWTAYKAIRNECILALATGQKVPGRYKMHDILITEYGFRDKPEPVARLIRRRRTVEPKYTVVETYTVVRDQVPFTVIEFHNGVPIATTEFRDGVTVTKIVLKEEEMEVISFVPEANYCPSIPSIQKYIEEAKKSVMAEVDFKEWAGAYQMNGNELLRREFDELGEETLVVIGRKPVRLAEERKKRGKKAA